MNLEINGTVIKLKPNDVVRFSQLGEDFYRIRTTLDSRLLISAPANGNDLGFVNVQPRAYNEIVVGRGDLPYSKEA